MPITTAQELIQIYREQLFVMPEHQRRDFLRRLFFEALDELLAEQRRIIAEGKRITDVGNSRCDAITGLISWITTMM